MGRMETGKASITDPAMGKPATDGLHAVLHPPVPAAYRLFDKTVPHNPRFRPAPRGSILKPRVEEAVSKEPGSQVCLDNKDACID